MQSIVEFLVKKHQSGISLKDAEKEIMNYIRSSWWKCSDDSEYYKIKFVIGQDDEGFYIDTSGTSSMICGENGSLDTKSFEYLFSENIDRYNKDEKGHCPYFRWRSHKGQIIIVNNLQKFNSLAGLPDKIDKLFIGEMVGCQSGIIDLGERQITRIRLHNVGKIKLTGKADVDEISWCGYKGKQPEVTFNCKNMHKE